MALYLGFFSPNHYLHLLFWFPGIIHRSDPIRSTPIDMSTEILRVVRGIVRDHDGRFIRAFFSSYGAARFLRWSCEPFSVVSLLPIDLDSRLWIEADYSSAIDCIIHGGGSWSIQAILRYIRHLVSLNHAMVSHIFREGI